MRALRSRSIARPCAPRRPGRRAARRCVFISGSKTSMISSATLSADLRRWRRRGSTALNPNAAMDVSLDARTRTLLEAPIVPTLLRLAIPNVITTLVQASTGLIEAYFIGMLGTDALAGTALVVPGIMLMQMMSAGAMGGGVSSAIARALGSGRRNDADALVVHALVIAA